MDWILLLAFWHLSLGAPPARAGGISAEARQGSGPAKKAKEEAVKGEAVKEEAGAGPSKAAAPSKAAKEAAAFM